MNQDELDRLCVNTLRFLAVDMVQNVDSGHPGMPLGAAPMAYVLGTRFLRRNPADPGFIDRDRFVLSSGHASALLVRYEAEALHVRLDEVAAIGDMPTDVLMFGLAGTSIAMGNASADVQRTARYVTASNEDDGFARAVDAFVLGESSRAPERI